MANHLVTLRSFRKNLYLSVYAIKVFVEGCILAYFSLNHFLQDSLTIQLKKGVIQMSSWDVKGGSSEGFADFHVLVVMMEVLSRSCDHWP